MQVKSHRRLVLWGLQPGRRGSLHALPERQFKILAGGKVCRVSLDTRKKRRGFSAAGDSLFRLFRRPQLPGINLGQIVKPT